MDQLYIQNALEQTFPYYRERREKDERESPMGSDYGGSAELAPEDDALYFETPYEGGPSGKHLNTFA
jgi:hypothetical protein